MTNSVNPHRFNRIMARVDVWAETNAGVDCRDEAAYRVEYILNDSEHCKMSDDELFDDVCAAWLQAE